MNELKLVKVFTNCGDFYKELEKFLSDKAIVDV